MTYPHGGASQIWRDGVGVPYNPLKPQIRDWAGAVEASVGYKTLQEMNGLAAGALSEGVLVRVAGSLFSVAPVSATDHHHQTLGGLKLYDLTPLHEAANLRQRKQYEPFTGFDDGTTDTQIFPGSRLPVQGICRLTVNGVEYDFIAVRDDSGGSAERFRIVQYQVGVSAAVAQSEILDLAHCQDLSGSVNGSTVTLYCQMGDGVDKGKGLSVVDWKGAATTQSDVATYQLFGSSGSGHRRESYKGSTVGVHGDKVVLLANDTKTPVDDTGHTLWVFSLAEILAAVDPLELAPIIGPIPISIGREEGQNTLQGCDVHEDHFRLLRGFINPRQRKAVQFFDYRGNHLRTLEYACSLNDFTAAELGQHPTYETLITIESEGITSDSLGRVIVICQEEWRVTGDVVSWEGKNFTPRRSSVTSSPDKSDDWVEVTAAASGPWVPGTYNWGGNYTRRAKPIHVIDKPLASGADDKLGSEEWFAASPVLVKGGQGAVDLQTILGQDFLIGGFAGAVRLMRRLMGYYNGFVLRLFDSREGSDNDAYGSISSNRADGRGIMEIRASGTLDRGAGINLYDKDDATHPGRIRGWGTKVDGTAVEAMSFDPDAERFDVLPGVFRCIGTLGARVAHTGDTLESTLHTLTVPGGAMGPNGCLRIHVQTGQTNNGNNKTLKVKLNGTEIINTTAGVSNSAGTSRLTHIYNTGSPTAQAVQGPSASADPGETGVAVTTLAVDTNQDFDITFTATLSNSADELALEGCVVEVCYVA